MNSPKRSRRRSIGRRTLWCVGLCVVIGMTTTASGQRFATPPRPFQEAVTLPVDNDAAKKLLTIDDRWALGRWQEALVDLVSLSQSHGASLVEVARDETLGLVSYQQVTFASERWLATLPPTGLEQYRKLVDPQAEELWQRWQVTGQRRPLELLLQRWFYSRFGPLALQELGQQAFHQGEFTAARAYWSALLPAGTGFGESTSRHSPTSPWPTADVAAWIVLCDLLTSENRGAATLATYRRQFPDAIGVLGGQTQNWVQHLEQLAQQQSDRPPFVFEGDIATFGGSIQRQAVSSRAIDLGGELWSIPLRTAHLPRTSRISLFPPAAPLPYFPAVVDDIVYMNDGERIQAVSLMSGLPAWQPLVGSSATIYPVGDREPGLQPRRSVSGSPSWTVTVANERLYACLGSPVTNVSPMEVRDLATELVCLDVGRGQGRLLWKITNAEIATRIAATEEDAPDWTWEGTPLVQGTRLFGVLSRRRPQLEWSVVCLDAESGQLLWHRPVGITRPSPPMHENLASHLLLTAAAGRLYLATHWGSVVALSEADGSLEWAATYRSEVWDESHPEFAPRAAHAPCLYHDGQIFVAPADSHLLFCFAAQTGQLLWTRQLDDRVSDILGCGQGRLVVSGRRLWGLDAGTGKVVWSLNSRDEDSRGYGRGWIAGSLVYWPSREAVCLVEWQTGHLLREHSLTSPDQHRSGGNLLVYDGVLLVAGIDHLTAVGEYAQLRQSQQNLLSQLSQHQQQFSDRARLRLGELALSTGDWPAAVGIWQDWRRQPESTSNGPQASSPGGLISPDGPVATDSILTSSTAHNLWQSRASRRIMAAHLQSRLESGVRPRERFTRAQQAARFWPQERELLLLELSQPVDVDWRLDVLARWLTHLQHCQHYGLDPPLKGPTPWQVQQEVAQLSQRHRPEIATRFPELLKTTPAAPNPLFRATGTAQLTEVEAAQLSTASGPQPATSIRGYFRKLWTHPRAAGTEPLPIAGCRTPPSSAIGPRHRHASYWQTAHGVAAWQLTTGEELWQVSVNHPVVAADLTDTQLTIVTARELLALAPESGQVLWRRPAPAFAENSFINQDVPLDWSWRFTPRQIVGCSPLQAVVAVDRANGSDYWRYDLTGEPWQPNLGGDDDWLIGQTASIGQPVWLRLPDGRPDPMLQAPHQRWRRPPVLATDSGEWATVDELGDVVCWNQQGGRRWTYTGVVSTGHAPPRVLRGPHTWFVLIDGMRLAEIDGRGRPRSMRSLTLFPLAADLAAPHNEQPQIEESTMNSVCRVDAATHSLVLADPQQILSLDFGQGGLQQKWRRESEQAGVPEAILELNEELIAIPWRPTAASASPGNCELYDRRTGELCQRISMPTIAHQSLRWFSQAGQLFCVSSGEITCYGRTATTVLAAD